MRKFPRRPSRGTFAALLVLLASGASWAGDPAIVRITDRGAEALVRQPDSVVRITDRPVVRGQSALDSEVAVQQAGLFSACPPSPACGDICCDPGQVHVSHGCPTWSYCPSPVCGQSSSSSWEGCPNCPSYHDCPECSPCGCGHKCPVIGWMVHALAATHEIKRDLLTSLGIPCHCGSNEYRCRRVRCRERGHSFARGCDRRQRLNNWFAHSRLNYFIPRGCCGKGCPPCGHYTIVYPVDPWYGDARDGGVYAAEGYGGPVSVPLAPVIRHTFNYGWGVPSSRLTPVSHLAMGPVYGAPYGYGPPPWGPAYPYFASGTETTNGVISSRPTYPADRN